MTTATLNIEINARDAERDLEQIDRQLNRVDRQSTRTGDKLRKMGQVMKIGFAAAAAGAVALTVAVRKTIDNLDSIAKTADKIGLTTDSLQQLRFAAEQSGVETRSLDMAMQRFARRSAEAAQGMGELDKEYKQLGISLRDVNGNMRTTDALLNDYADAIMNAESETEALRLAFKGFDSEGAALVNMLRDGSKGLDEFRQEAIDLGIIIDEDLVRGAAEAQDQLNRVANVLKAKLTVALAGLIPTLIKVGNALIDFINLLGKAVEAVKAFYTDVMFVINTLTENTLSAKLTAQEAQLTAMTERMAVLVTRTDQASRAELANLTRQYNVLKGEIYDTVKAIDKDNKAQTALNKASKELVSTTTQLEEVQAGVVVETTAAATAMDEYTESVLQAQASDDLLIDKLIQLDELFMENKISSEIYGQELEKLIPATKELGDTTVQEVGEMTKIWDNFVENTQRAFGDLIYDNMKSILADGKLTFKDFTDTILDMFLRMLAEMVAAWAASKLFGGSAGGGLLSGLTSAFSGGTTGGGPIGSIISKGLTSSISGGIAGGIGQGIGAAGGAGAYAALGGSASSWMGANVAFGAGDVAAGVSGLTWETAPVAMSKTSAAAGKLAANMGLIAPAVVAVALAYQGWKKSERIDEENAAFTDQFNQLRLHTNEFAGELLHVNENLTIVGQSADALYVRQTQANEANKTHFYEYYDALKEAGIGIRQIYDETGAQIQMITGDLAKAHEIISAGFDNAKVKATQFTTHTNSKLTTLTTKFTGSTNEWKQLLQGAMDSGKVSADATFKFIEDASGQTFLKLTGDANEWSDHLAAAGRLGVGAVETEFNHLDAAGQQVFGNLSSEAMQFQNTLNSLTAPTLHIPVVYDDVSRGINTAASMDGFATGGTFTVGGSGSTDTTPVAFMATRGEQVTVSTPGQQADSNGPSSEATNQMIELLQINNALLSEQVAYSEEQARSSARVTSRRVIAHA